RAHRLRSPRSCLDSPSLHLRDSHHLRDAGGNFRSPHLAWNVDRAHAGGNAHTIDDAFYKLVSADLVSVAHARCDGDRRLELDSPFNLERERCLDAEERPHLRRSIDGETA